MLSLFRSIRSLPVLALVAVLALGSGLFAADLPPVISAPALATPSNVVAKTTKLTMSATDDGGAAALTYAWAATGPGVVTFSATGTNAAKTVTATFKVDGVYAISGTVTDIAGHTVTSAVAVTVQQTLTTLAISPTTAVVNPGLTKAFAVTSKDQFGTVMTGLTPVWAVSGTTGSTVDATGLFTAGQPGSCPVTVTVGAKTATATVRVNAAPTVATAAAPALPTTAGKTAEFTVQGADDTSIDLLTYTWSATGPKAVAFSPRSSVLSEHTVATFAALGDYTITVVISDKEGLTTTSTTAITVLPTPTTVAISPTTAVVNPLAVKSFTATAKDQFGVVLALQPAYSWSAVGGTMDATGSFTAGSISGTGSVTTTVVGYPTATATATLRINAAPTVAIAAATPTSSISGKTAEISVQGADDTSIDLLTYTWSATGPKGVAFSPRRSILGENTLATFTAVGDYIVTVVINDKEGLTATSSTAITVLPMPTSLTISPTTAVVNPAAAKAFVGSAKDQFGAAMLVQPVLAWTAVGGTIDATGHFTAGAVAGAASATVSIADQPSLSVSAAIRINAAPTIATAAQIAEATPARDVPLHLTVLAADDAGEAGLTYAWSVAAGGTTGVVFSGATQKTNAAQALIVTVSRAGTYVFKATIRDAQGLTVTSSVSVVVSALITPVITWAAPAPIGLGTALSEVQLSATASEPGTFIYDPPAGTTPGIGSVVLTATFVPTDPLRVATASAQRTLVVQQFAPPEVSYFYFDHQPLQQEPFAFGVVVNYAGPHEALTYTWTLLSAPSQSAMDTAVISGAEQGTNAAQTILLTLPELGFYVFEVRIGDADGGITTSVASFEVIIPSSDITWNGWVSQDRNDPVPTSYGTRADSLFNAYATRFGSMSYSLPGEYVFPVGVTSLTATFTPSDPAFAATTSTIWILVTPPENMITPYVSMWFLNQLQAGASFELYRDVSLSVNDPTNWNELLDYAIESTPADGTILLPDVQEIAVIIRPYDESTYAAVRVSLWIDLRPPVTVDWATPAPLEYGTVLSEAQLNASASVPGTYVYNPPLGTLLEVGEQQLIVTFRPTDPTREITGQWILLQVVPTTPLISVAVIHRIWGEMPIDADLIVTSSQPGELHFPTLIGWDFQAGTQVIPATFTPADAVHVATVTVPVTVIFDRAAPTVVWSNPWTIREGTPLSADQLNAAAGQSGTFAYTPAAGALLGVGTHVLQVTFTPTDTVHFGPVTISVPLTVVAATVDLPGLETSYEYDATNHMSTRKFSTAASDSFVYDRVGRLTQATAGRSQVVVERGYDAAGRVTAERVRIDQEELSVQSHYDAAGRLTTQTYPDGSIVKRDYSTRGELTQVWDGSTKIATRAYDDGGRLVQTQSGNGLIESRTYAPGENQVATIKVPGVTDFSYVYDANQRKTSEVDGITAVNTQKFAYDHADRVTDWQRTAGAAGPVQSRQSWDLSAVGDWNSTTIDGTVQNRTHTPVHEIASVGTVQVTSDFKGNLTRDDQGQEYAWDVENRLASATHLKQGHGDEATYLYDALGRRVKKTVTTHVAAVGDVPAHDVVEKIYFISAGAQEVMEITGDLSAFNDPSADSESVGVAPFDSATGTGARGSLLADPVAQRINFQPASTDTPDGWNADLGQMSSNVTTPGWATAVAPIDRDHLGRPLYDSFAPLGASTWSMPVANGTHAVVIMCGDADSRAQTNHLLVNGVPVRDLTPFDGQALHGYETGSFDGYAITVNVIDGFITIAGDADAVSPKLCFVEIGAAGSAADAATIDRVAAAADQATKDTAKPRAKMPPLVKRNVWGDYVDQLVSYTIAKPRKSAVCYFTHSNLLFSIAATTNTAGQVVEKYSYNAYGVQTISNTANVSLTKSSVSQDRGFTGYRIDVEMGWNYARARMYSARLGRFVSRDPREFKNGYGLYIAYFSPNNLDPSGETVVLNNVFDVISHYKTGHGEDATFSSAHTKYFYNTESVESTINLEYKRLEGFIRKWAKESCECYGPEKNPSSVHPFKIVEYGNASGGTLGLEIGGYQYTFEGNVTMKFKWSCTSQDVLLTGKWTVKDTFKIDKDWDNLPGHSPQEAALGNVFEGIYGSNVVPYKINFGWSDISRTTYYKAFPDFIWEQERSPW